MHTVGIDYLHSILGCISGSGSLIVHVHFSYFYIFLIIENKQLNAIFLANLKINI